METPRKHSLLTIFLNFGLSTPLQTCLNKRVADEFSADETRFRCTGFVPISLNV
jgi:hypothetical protein